MADRDDGRNAGAEVIPWEQVLAHAFERRHRAEAIARFGYADSYTMAATAGPDMPDLDEDHFRYAPPD